MNPYEREGVYSKLRNTVLPVSEKEKLNEEWAGLKHKYLKEYNFSLFQWAIGLFVCIGLSSICGFLFLHHIIIALIFTSVLIGCLLYMYVSFSMMEKKRFFLMHQNRMNSIIGNIELDIILIKYVMSAINIKIGFATVCTAMFLLWIHYLMLSESVFINILFGVLALIICFLIFNRVMNAKSHELKTHIKNLQFIQNRIISMS